MDDAASEIARLRAALAASEARAASAEADLAQVRAVVTTSEAMIRHLKLEIAKMRREQYGQSSERRARLIDQMELQLEELEAGATEDEIAAERVAAKITNVSAFERRRPARKPFPEHLPRERVIIEAPAHCACCGSARIVKMGEDITETLEAIPRQWKVIQTVREKFTCRDCEKISQPPAPFHATPHGWAGPNLLATILFEKFGHHQPLNRQAERYPIEGVDLSLSTLADQVGACATALQPIHDLIRAHVLAARRLHDDDTTVPLLAKGATRQAGLWTYVRDDRPLAGGAPPAALFHFSPDREKTHPNRHLTRWHGTLQADAYGGYNDLYRAGRSPAPVISALCWSHARRKFFELADIAGNVRKRSRLLFGMARDGDLPRSLTRTLGSGRSPWLGALTYLVVACGFAAVGEIEFVASLSSLGVTLVFAAINMAVIAIRFTQPGLERPFRLPSIANVPLTAALGVVSSLLPAAQYGWKVYLTFGGPFLLGAVPYALVSSRRARKGTSEDESRNQCQAEPIHDKE